MLTSRLPFLDSRVRGNDRLRRAFSHFVGPRGTGHEGFPAKMNIPLTSEGDEQV